MIIADTPRAVPLVRFRDWHALSMGKNKPATNSEDDGRMPLVLLVAIGTAIVTGAGTSLFLWLVWLLSHQPAPLRGESGWWDWLAFINGGALFDAARTTATILAVVGIGGAALVAYRRQDTAERAHRVAIDGQRIANAQHMLDSQKYELDRSRHQLELGRREDDRERELRTRFATVAQQLGTTDYSVRHAGAYALASLADDWHRFGSDSERQVCVDLLCAQLRMPRLHQHKGEPLNSFDRAQDDEVRKTMIALLRSHRPLEKSSGTWSDCAIDLNGADLTDAYFYETDLSTANLNAANLKLANMTKMNLVGANLRRANLTSADFSRSNMTSARIWHVSVSESESRSRWGSGVTFSKTCLRGALIFGSQLPNTDFSESDLTKANLMSGNFERSSFEGAKLVNTLMRKAKLGGSDFSNADLSGARLDEADVEGVGWDGIVYDEATIWPRGFQPPPSQPKQEQLQFG